MDAKKLLNEAAISEAKVLNEETNGIKHMYISGRITNSQNAGRSRSKNCGIIRVFPLIIKLSIV